MSWSCWMDLKMWNYIEDAKPSLLAPSRIKAKVIHQKLNIKRTCSFLRSTLIKLLLLHRTTKYCCWKFITFMSFQAVIFFAAFCMYYYKVLILLQVKKFYTNFEWTAKKYSSMTSQFQMFTTWIDLQIVYTLCIK